MKADVAPKPIRATPKAASDDGTPEIRAGATAFIAFFVIFLGWAAFAPLDAAVVAPGVVVVSGNRQSVQHREGGVVSVLSVEEGQRVRQGQILLELGDPAIVAQERALFSQLVGLQMQRARLNAEIAGARSIERPVEWLGFSEQDRAIAEQIFARYTQGTDGRRGSSEYEARISGYRNEVVSVARQQSLLDDELVGMRSLAERQLVPLTRVRALERARAELDGRRSELSAEIAATQQERSEQLRDVEARLLDVQPRFVAAREQLERTRVRAPTAGSVVGLTLHTVGGVVAPGERIMDIVPDGRDLIVQARVRPDDADDLVAGQTAEVRLTSIGGRNMPILTGRVLSVSADRFTDERSGQAYFMAQIGVPPDELSRAATRGGARLRAGLSAEVIVPTRKRSALQYLLEPLNQALWRSFREG